ncbi:hypothetical protein [Dyella subtropica]|uniref:hypothetical protein n=1 Tax=Dyella subtropica TaxID=2992127 RepID=UPI002255A713|nr:hypothetical protein [Dyella subtropica]
MRAALIMIGLILVVAGIWVLSGHALYQETDTLVQLGSAKITATHDKAVPSWVGIAGVVVGGLLTLGGFFKKG